MQPKLSLLTDELIRRILDEAFQLMLKPGIKVQNGEARELLASAGAQLDAETFVARIPEQIVRKALETVPRQFRSEPGIKVQNGEARELLASAGAQLDAETFVARIPEQIVRKALETVPRQF